MVVYNSVILAALYFQTLDLDLWMTKKINQEDSSNF